MKRVISAAAGLLCMGVAFSGFAAGEHATPEQAEALVHKAVAYYKAKGPEAAFAEFSKADGLFSHGDQYVNVYDLQGKCLAHINQKTIGKNMIDLRDPDGKYLIRERIERARKEGEGWQDYKFYDPATHKVEPKHMFFEKVGDVVFASGAYKPEKK
jgi:signal transduction histidine kinase